MLVQRLQHQAVAAERDHDIGIAGLVIAIERRQLRQRLLGLRAGARDKGDPVISLGAGHGINGLGLKLEGSAVPEVVYMAPGACRDRPAAGECH